MPTFAYLLSDFITFNALLCALIMLSDVFKKIFSLRIPGGNFSLEK